LIPSDRRPIRRRVVDPYAPLSPQRAALHLASFTVLLTCAFGLVELFGEDPATRYSTATLCAVCFAVAAADWYIELVIRKSRLPRLIGEMILVAALAAWGLSISNYAQHHNGSLRVLTDGLACFVGCVGIGVLGRWRRRRNQPRTDV
jgi:hypothetical protein